MKKQYVKPVMESEAFVANEYVAACWTITCTNSEGSCGALKIKGIENYPDSDVLIIDSENNRGNYVGLIGNVEPGCIKKGTESYKDYDMSIIGFLTWLYDVIFGSTTETTYEYFHPVYVTDGYTTDDNKYHPKASV